MSVDPMTITINAASKKGPILLNMTVYNQFDFQGKWFKGNLHSHLGRSNEVQKIADWYETHEYDFLALTDHDVIRPADNDRSSGLTIIQGAEISECHVVGLGIDRVAPRAPRSAAGLTAILESIKSQGGIAVLAHPHWMGWSWDELRTAAEAGIGGFEVFNSLCKTINGKGRADQLWELLIQEGYFPAAVGSDDAHSMDSPCLGGAWTGVLAGENSQRSLFESIASNRTYASEGPSIKSIVWDPEGLIRVECSPCTACYFSSVRSGARGIYPEPPDRTSERFELNLAVQGYRIERYVRIVIEDDHGRRAWSSPIRVDVTQNDV